MKPELVLNVKATLGEGPCWDEKEQQLYWIDIMEKRIHRFDPQSGVNDTIQLEQYVGCAVLKENGGLLLGLQGGIFSLNVHTKELTLIEDPEPGKEENRFNDGKVDPAGRFWAGTMNLNGKEREGSLYCMDSDMIVRKVLGDVSISNGLAWDSVRNLMYYIDTPTKKIVAFDYDLETGEISNKRDVVRIPETEGSPDGMTIDSEGMIWVAHWDGARITRWDPTVGEKLDDITFPVQRITSCCFGGKEMDELFVTTASIGLNDKEKVSQPLAGGLFRVKTGIKGVPSYRFR